MKRIVQMVLLMTGLMMVTVTSCKKLPVIEEEKTGSAVFWLDDNPQYDIVVSIGLVQKCITKYYPNPDYTPTCGSEGCATFENISPATYHFRAENQLYRIEGDIDIVSGACSVAHLNIVKAEKKENPVIPSGLHQTTAVTAAD